MNRYPGQGSMRQSVSECTVIASQLLFDLLLVCQRLQALPTRITLFQFAGN